MSGDYTLVKNATDAINELIRDKESEIEKIELEIFQLKQTKRMLNTEFVNKKTNHMVG
jgi:Mg2+ and Co2+ transporter CorA